MQKWLRVIFAVLIAWLQMNQFWCNTFLINVVGFGICHSFHETNDHADVLENMRCGHGSYEILYQKILTKVRARQSGRFGPKTSIQPELWVIKYAQFQPNLGSD
jgi:hypothetical protein